MLLFDRYVFQKFGMNDKSLQCYKELVQRRSKGQDEQGVDKCFQDMLAQSKTNKNASLTRALERLYTNWQDSIKAVKAAQELKLLQDEYAASQNTLEEKESKISTQKGTIIFLCNYSGNGRILITHKAIYFVCDVVCIL